MYMEFFGCLGPEDSINLREQHPDVLFRFREMDPGADPGVEMESTIAPDVLAANLGFMDDLPILFNHYRHHGGLSPWDPANASLFKQSNAQYNPDMNPITLHWHQLAGVHALICMIFGPDAMVDRICGALIADKVGLGKTYQAATMIAFLTDLVIWQTINAPLPPIIREFSSSRVTLNNLTVVDLI
jgi:hypothetical protein